jgi:hypothetical protein
MLAAFALALILYRSAEGRHADDYDLPVFASSSVDDRPVLSGHSKEFWIQTAIAIAGLIITAVSAAAAWWR